MQEEVVSFNITNTTNGSIPMSIMGNNTDVMDNSNASTRYYWDLTGFSLTTEDTITIQYQYTGQSGFSTASVKVQGTTLQSIADALNTLNIGTFFLTSSGGSTFLNNYNQNVAYGSLNIIDSTTIINTTFVVGTGFDGQLIGLAIQSDGKVLCGGSFTTYDVTSSNYIIRLNTDGSVDTTFNIGGGFDGAVYVMAVQTDGKILCGGAFTNYDGTSANKIIRLNSDGSIDGTFVYGSGFNAEPFTISIQTDGKILVGGVFTTYNGTGASAIIRLNTNGSIDGTFVYGTGFDSGVTSIALQTDGKIVVGGNFTLYNGTSTNQIIRLNTNGSVDGTFVYGTGFDLGVTSIVIQTDGKIVVGGSFTTYNGTGTNGIIRLNTNGSVDGTFVYGTGFDLDCNAIVLQTDGKLVCGGAFSTYNGTNANRIIRLNTNGSVDTSWNYGTGFSGGFVFSIVKYASLIYVGGDFTTFQGQSYNYIISLNL
jgi:uncharacterized delta-60 repeat protein